MVSRSRYQLSYQQAQDVLDGRRPAPGHEVAAADREQLRGALTLLKDVTDSLRARRQAVRAGCNCYCVCFVSLSQLAIGFAATNRLLPL